MCSRRTSPGTQSRHRRRRRCRFVHKVRTVRTLGGARSFIVRCCCCCASMHACTFIEIYIYINLNYSKCAHRTALPLRTNAWYERASHSSERAQVQSLCLALLDSATAAAASCNEYAFFYFRYTSERTHACGNVYYMCLYPNACVRARSFAFMPFNLRLRLCNDYNLYSNEREREKRERAGKCPYICNRCNGALPERKVAGGCGRRGDGKRALGGNRPDQ